MGQAEYSLGIDIGTTSVKVIAFLDGAPAVRASRRVAMLPADVQGAREQDVRAVHGAVMEALGEVSAQLVGGRVRCVGFSAAMHSLLAVDAAGRPLTGALTWLDTRATPQADAIWATSLGRGVYGRTGTPIHPMSPLPKLVWLREERPEVFNQAARFVSIKEWIWHRWFGEWVIDHSMASATGLFDIRRQVWDEQALTLAGVDADRLSQPVPTSHSRHPEAGSELAALGLDASVSMNIGASDGVLANLGVGVVDHRAMVLTIGTSCAVRVGSARPVADPETRLFSYILTTGRYVVGAPSNSGGVVLDHLHRSLFNAAAAPPLPELLAQAGAVESGTLVYLPYVAGERAPLWNAAATGALIGLTTQHRPEHVVRAAVEGVLLNARWMAERLMQGVGQPERVVACGKLFALPWTRQLAADVFGVPVQTAEAADASTLGAVLWAEICARWRTWNDVAPPAPEELHQPDPRRHTLWTERLRRFQQLAGALGLTTEDSPVTAQGP
ncbi:gluconokinase [Alicyclobacillus kakegawensis]|uniref:gluconokinase n=1 Tax=Alicyclobacillus kakegawensis TaxID=392012 RepID=UPI00082D9909|nr:gluconokinase [Alicyclobacillus kakegawensis]